MADALLDPTTRRRIALQRLIDECPAGGTHTPGIREDDHGNERRACAECGALEVIDLDRLDACTAETPHTLDECVFEDADDAA